MKINKEIINKLNPCKDRFETYLRFYGDKEHTKAQFMGLKNIAHSDKIWVALRLVPEENLRFIAADIAEGVLPLYENTFPTDLRPRKAIEAARTYGLGFYKDHASAAAKGNRSEQERLIRKIILRYRRDSSKDLTASRRSSEN